MRLLAAFSLFLIATPGIAQAPPQFEGAGAERQLARNRAMAAPVDSLDALITGIMADHDVPGVALVVMKGNRVIKEGYYGTANLEHQAPVTRETSFEIASMTKPFTAAAIMLLVQEGKLRLDNPITHFIPEAPATWNAVTIRMLLSHTAGLRDDWDEDWDDIPGFFMANQSDQQFLNEFFKRPLKFTPGDSFDYGAGTFVLGVVIERVTGRAYAEFMHDRMFRPLGLSHTSVINPYAIVPHRADGYIQWGKLSDRPWPWSREGSRPRGALSRGLRISPAANARGDVGIRTTALELGSWIAALNGGRIVSQQSLQEMYTPVRLGNTVRVPVGLAWYSEYFRARPAISHDGSFRTGFLSAMEYYPRDDLTIVLLQNLHDGGRSRRNLMRAVYNQYVPHMRPISTMPIAPDPDPRHTQRMQRVIKALAAGTADPMVVTENMQVPQDPSTRETLGRVSSLSYINCEDTSAEGLAIFGTSIARLCYYRLNLREDPDAAQGPLYTAVAMTAAGKVAYVDWPESH